MTKVMFFKVRECTFIFTWWSCYWHTATNDHQFHNYDISNSWISLFQSVTLHTDLGDLKLELFCDKAPRTCEVSCEHTLILIKNKYLSITAIIHVICYCSDALVLLNRRHKPFSSLLLLVPLLSHHQSRILCYQSFQSFFSLVWPFPPLLLLFL